MCQVSPKHSVSNGASAGALPVEFTHSRTEVNGLGLAEAHSEASFLNPNLPLQYVDLGRFDGRTEGQRTHTISQPKSSSVEGYSQPRSSSMEAYVQPRASSMEGYDQVRSVSVEGYNTVNGSVTSLPPSGRNGHSTLSSGGDNRSGTKSGGRSPSQHSQEYQQELILEQARQQAQRDLQHSYVNLGPVLPKNMSSKVRNHYVNVSIHHQNLNHYVNMTEQLKEARKEAEAASSAVAATSASASATGAGGNKDWRKYMLAYHNSLKRPRSADSRTRGSVTSTSPARESAPHMTRSRGKSLDNIFSGSHFDVVMPIHISDNGNGSGDTPKSSPHPGPKSPRRSISVDSAHSSADISNSNKVRPALPPRTKPPVTLPISKAQSTASSQHQQGNTVTTVKKTLTRPATAPALGRLLMSPSSPAGSRSSSGAHTPVSPCTRSPPTHSGASNSDYMMMQGFPREDSHSPIFCAVELPRRNASFSSHGTRSRNCSFSSAASEDQVNYMDMSLGQPSRGSPSRENRLKAKARLAREGAVDLPPKPKLMQSRSLDNELEDNYLRMDVGNIAPRTPNEDYMCMSPSGDEAQPVGSSGDELDDNRSNSSGGGATEKSGAPPFENLIQHLPYTDRKKVQVPKSKSVDSGSNTPPLPDPPSQSKQRFLSRLIRRNSSKSERKSAKSTNEECLSPPNEPDIPEGTTTDVKTKSAGLRNNDPFGLAPPQQHRKASWDDRQGVNSHEYEYPNVAIPKKGRSMSYSTGMPEPPSLPHGLPHQGSNLTDEEKQQTSRLLSRMGLSPPHHPAVSSAELKSMFVPALPTKSTEAFNPPKMVDSPAYMLVVPGQIPTTMTNSDHKFMSKSDIVGYVEHDYCEPDLPPTLPRKTGKRRKSRDVILTSPTSFLSGSSRSSSNDRNLSSPASADLLYATDDGKASSTSSSAATSPRSVPRNQENWLLVNIPAAQQPDHVHGNVTEDIWVQRSPVTPQDFGSLVRSKKTNSLPRTISGNIADIAAAAGLPRTISESSHLQKRATVSGTGPHHHGSPPRKAGSQPLGDSSVTRGSVVSLPTGRQSPATGHHHHHPHDDTKASAATTVLRPRFGKEYKKLDRKKLVEELNSMGLGSPKTPNSPSVGVGGSPSVFTFDVSSTSSHMSGLSGLSSMGDESPRSPSLISRYSGNSYKDHDYVNLGISRELADSPRFSDMTPPGSPRSFTSEQSNPMLNYAEIDFSGTKGNSDKKPVRRTISKGSDIDYAMIDMIATTAAQKVGKEHAQSREDSLKKKERRTAAEETASNSSSGSRRGKDKKSTSSASLSRKGSSRSQSGSRDRKFSSPM